MNSRFEQLLVGLGLVTMIASTGVTMHNALLYNEVNSKYRIEHRICKKYDQLEKELQNLPNDHSRFTVSEAQKNYREARGRHQQALTLELKAREPDYEYAQKRLEERNEKISPYVTHMLGGIGGIFIGGVMLAGGLGTIARRKDREKLK